MRFIGGHVTTTNILPFIFAIFFPVEVWIQVIQVEGGAYFKSARSLGACPFIQNVFTVSTPWYLFVNLGRTLNVFNRCCLSLQTQLLEKQEQRRTRATDGS